MKRLTIRSVAMLVMLTALSACSAKCNCPVCPVAAQPQTTIIHEPQ